MAVLTGITGLVKIGTEKNITLLEKDADSVRFECGVHGLLAGDRVIIADVGGLTDLNGFQTITLVNGSSVDIDIVSSQTWTSGGTIQRHIPVTKWSVKGAATIENVNDSETDDWEENIVLRKSFEITIEGHCKEGASIPVEGDSLTFTLEIDELNNFSGTGIVSDVSIDDDIKGGGLVVFNVTAKGTGTKTKTDEVA